MESVSVLLTYLVIILVSLSLHEMAHALASYLLGDDTAKLQNRISINPFNHLDIFLSVLLPLFLMLAGLPIFGGAKPVNVNSRRIRWGDYGMALVALAGPMANFLLAFICFGVASAFYGAGFISWAKVFILSCQVNLGLMLFNLIPIPPLDGSRVMYSLVPESVQDVMRRLEAQGMVIIFTIVVFAGGMISSYIVQSSNLIIQLFSLIFGVASL